MNKTIKLTVAVAIYNIESYLEKCLDSLLNQTEKEDYEILLINDGSIDSSKDICEKYIQKGLKATIVDKTNEGLTSVRNLSINLAKGEYILFLDGDDYLEKNAIEVIFNHIEQFDMLVFGFNWVSTGKSEKDLRFLEKKEYSGNHLERLIYSEELNTSVWNKVFKLKVLKDENILFRNLIGCEDILFVYEYILKIKNLKKIDNYLYNYVYRENSLSKNKSIQFFISYLNVIEYFLKKEKKKNNEFYQYILNIYIFLIRDLIKIKEYKYNIEIRRLRKEIEKNLEIKRILFNDKIKFKMKLRYLKIRGRE